MGTVNWWRLSPDITGSYVTGIWSPIASFPAGYPAFSFSSAVLPDGRVLIQGGEFLGSATQVETNIGAIYDPVVNTWTPVQPPSGWDKIGDAPNVVLSDGTFLLGSCCSPQTALFNASTLTWTATGSKAAISGEAGFTLLPDGSVLSVGVGLGGQTCGTNTAELYIAGANNWVSAGSTIVQLADGFGSQPTFEIGPQVLRPDGTVVVFGGTTSGGPAHTAIYNTNTGTWAAGPDLPTIGGHNYTLADDPAAVLPSGRVLFAAHQQDGTSLHFFALDGTSITEVPGFGDNAGTRMLVLPTGQILVAASGVAVYTEAGTANPAWAPVITAVPTELTTSGTYQLSGRQLSGLSQGAAFGDEFQSATNYPLVRIVNTATGHVFYARSFGHSSMSVAPNNSSTTNFTVPPIYAIETGPSLLYVVANGIASNPVPVTVVEGPVPTPPLVAAVLPSSRSVQIGETATVFATLINAGSFPVSGCAISLAGNLPATLTYQTTNPATNAVTGSPNTPVNIPGWGAQTFVVSITPTAMFPPTDVAANFSCAKTGSAPVISGVSTVLLSASAGPVPDIVALVASGDPGIVDIPGANGTGVLAVATVNVGASGSITMTADTGGVNLPVSILLCQTNPQTSACLPPGPAASVTTLINAGDTPTYGVFVAGTGVVPFDPANNRIFFRAKDAGGVTRGSTSVAVRTQ
jgi:hypothetical protein